MDFASTGELDKVVMYQFVSFRFSFKKILIFNMSVLRRFTNVVPRAVQRRTQIVLAQEQAALAPVSAETSALLKQAEQPWAELSVETKKVSLRDSAPACPCTQRWRRSKISCNY